MTTIFTVSTLDRQTENDAVTAVHWVATKTDGEIVASVYSCTNVEVGDSFIPYADLTESIVIEWVKNKIDLEKIEESLEAQLLEQKEPKLAKGLPWITI
jgi:hypothetical protein